MINLSNHPSTKWGEKQLKAAEGWCCGKVIDMPFPQVGPEWSTEEVVGTAVRLANAIEASSCTVSHVMGESGLMYSLCALLQEEGQIQAIYSTTERKVVEKVKEDGTVEKTAQFEFVKFRAYW